jgi:uncharacterized BrkB/YihY/UPF0761 family membrane protein
LTLGNIGSGANPWRIGLIQALGATMQRNVLWIFVALVPIAILLMFAFGEEAISNALLPTSTSHGDIVLWLYSYWWLILMAVSLVHMLFFIVHALGNRRLGWSRRLLWAVANLIAWPISALLYVWFCSNSAPAERARL